MFDNLLARCNVTRMVTYVTQWHTCTCLRQRHWACASLAGGFVPQYSSQDDVILLSPGQVRTRSFIAVHELIDAAQQVGSAHSEKAGGHLGESAADARRNAEDKDKPDGKIYNPRSGHANLLEPDHSLLAMAAT
jgi:hypothetical protein